jgi:hypothetical protein
MAQPSLRYFVVCNRCSRAALVLAALALGCGDGEGRASGVTAGRDTDVAATETNVTRPTDLPPGTAGDEPAGDGSCVWGVDELLAEVGASVGARTDCGTLNSLEVRRAIFECFNAAAARGDSVEFTVNDCIDCSIPSTYVWTPADGALRVLMEADIFGDELREARVEKCSELSYEGGAFHCAEPVVLYACKDPL